MDSPFCYIRYIQKICHIGIGCILIEIRNTLVLEKVRVVGKEEDTTSPRRLDNFLPPLPLWEMKDLRQN